jgi:DNA-binding GntR family transcriptional regulator
MKNIDIEKSANFRKGKTIDEVFHRLKEMIYFNEIAPGQKLIYSSICKKLKVSATPVVQALNRLKASGLVEYKPNKGYFVAEISELEAYQLYEAREALECYIIPRVIKELDADKINSIKKSLKRYQETDRTELILIDAKFHLKIAEHAGNQVIHDLLKDLFERIYLKYRTHYIDDTRIKEVIKEHKMLLAAIIDKDGVRAKEVIRLHLRHGVEHLVAGLQPKTSVYL